MPPLDVLLFVAIGFGTLFGWVAGHGFPRRPYETIGGQV